MLDIESFHGKQPSIRAAKARVTRLENRRVLSKKAPIMCSLLISRESLNMLSLLNE